jgi:hypothetical protein
MARQDKNMRKKAKEKRRKTHVRARENRRRIAKLPNLTDIPQEELLRLIPKTDVETIVGRSLEWCVYTTKEDILKWSVAKYNHCAITDVHERCKGMPKERHPSDFCRPARPECASASELFVQFPPPIEREIAFI